MSRNHVILKNGPFTLKDNLQDIENYQIKCMVTKDSGKEGGFFEKKEAALIKKIPLIVLKRPKLNRCRKFEEIESLLAYISAITRNK